MADTLTTSLPGGVLPRCSAVKWDDEAQADLTSPVRFTYGATKEPETDHDTWSLYSGTGFKVETLAKFCSRQNGISREPSHWLQRSSSGFSHGGQYICF